MVLGSLYNILPYILIFIENLFTNSINVHNSSADEVKEHVFFAGIDWQQVYHQKYTPPLIPPRGEVNAADAFDIGSFDEEDTKGIKVWKIFNLVL